MVIPKQDTFLCIADRSLSRLRGSPLPGAGCLGPGARVGGIILPDADAGALSFAWVRISGWVLLRRLCRRGAFGWLRRWGLGWVLGLRLAWVRLPCQVLLRRLCRRGAFGWLCRLGLGWVLGLSLAWVRISGWVLLRRLWPPVRVWVGCAAWNWLGAGHLSHVGAS